MLWNILFYFWRKTIFYRQPIYNVSPGDLFVINQYESHYITALNKNAHERINIAVHPEFLSSISTEQTQLDSCFTFRPQNVSHRIPLDCINQQRLIYYIHKITCTSGYGSDIIENAAFSELLAMINYQFMYKHQEYYKRCQCTSSGRSFLYQWVIRMQNLQKLYGHHN